MEHDFLDIDLLLPRSVLVLENGQKALVIRDTYDEGMYNQLIYQDGTHDSLDVAGWDIEDTDCKYLCIGDLKIKEMYNPCAPKDFIKDPFYISDELKSYDISYTNCAVG